jgi:hypothetical protein
MHTRMVKARDKARALAERRRNGELSDEEGCTGWNLQNGGLAAATSRCIGFVPRHGEQRVSAAFPMLPPAARLAELRLIHRMDYASREPVGAIGVGEECEVCTDGACIHACAQADHVDAHAGCDLPVLTWLPEQSPDPEPCAPCAACEDIMHATAVLAQSQPGSPLTQRSRCVSPQSPPPRPWTPSRSLHGVESMCETGTFADSDELCFFELDGLVAVRHTHTHADFVVDACNRHTNDAQGVDVLDSGEIGSGKLEVNSVVDVGCEYVNPRTLAGVKVPSAEDLGCGFEVLDNPNNVFNDDFIFVVTAVE